MKKVLVGFLLIATLLLNFQVITVHADFFYFKNKLEGMISDIEEIFKERKITIAELLWDQQEERLHNIDENLAEFYARELNSTTDELKQYKRDYLMEITDLMESISLDEPYEELLEQHSKNIESTIENDIEHYIRQLLGQENTKLIKMY